MAFPRYVDKLWKEAKDQINAIGDYFEGLAATMSGRVKNSLENDPVDGKAQLVNDLTDAELIPNLVYGTDEDGVRGYRVGVSHVHYYEKHTVTAGEAASGVINLILGTYTIGDNSLAAEVQGQGKIVGDDYTETSVSRVTFITGCLTEGDAIIFRWQK